MVLVKLKTLTGRTGALLIKDKDKDLTIGELLYKISKDLDGTDQCKNLKSTRYIHNRRHLMNFEDGISTMVHKDGIIVIHTVQKVGKIPEEVSLLDKAIGDMFEKAVIAIGEDSPYREEYCKKLKVLNSNWDIMMDFMRTNKKLPVIVDPEEPIIII